MKHKINQSMASSRTYRGAMGWTITPGQLHAVLTVSLCAVHSSCIWEGPQLWAPLSAGAGEVHGNWELHWYECKGEAGGWRQVGTGRKARQVQAGPAMCGKVGQEWQVGDKGGKMHHGAGVAGGCSQQEDAPWKKHSRHGQGQESGPWCRCGRWAWPRVGKQSILWLLHMQTLPIVVLGWQEPDSDGGSDMVDYWRFCLLIFLPFISIFPTLQLESSSLPLPYFILPPALLCSLCIILDHY